MAAKATPTPETETPPETEDSTPTPETETPIIVFEFVSGVCPQCGYPPRSNLEGQIFCPDDNPKCPRHLG